MPRRERRRERRRLRALAEAHDISALFPSVRLRSEAVEAFAERVALELDPADPRVPADRVEEGVVLLDESERRRIVDDWAGRYPDRWAGLCGAVGDVALTERVVVASAVRGAISERRPVARNLVVPLDDGTLQPSPCAAVALVLAPPLVWTRDDALLVARAASRTRDMGRRFEEAMELADAQVADRHVERVQVLAARLARQLPVAQLPRASATLAEGCSRLAQDVALARAVACTLLAVYAGQAR